MKKILVVLTILVLVAGFAFADISGKVSAEYGIGFFNALYEDADGNWQVYDATSTTYKPTSKQLLATVTLDKQIGGKTGEVTPYVDLKITAEFSRVYLNSETGYLQDYDVAANAPADKFKVSIDTFAIVGEDWSVNLLKAEGAKLDLAKSAIDSVTFHEDFADENTQYFSMKKDIAYTKGLSVTYKDFVVGFGINTADLRDDNAAITVEAKTPEFAFGDVKVQAGVGFSQTGNTYKAGTAETYTSIGTFYYLEGEEYVEGEEMFVKTDATEATGDFGGVKAFVASAKIAYDTDAVKASVAADFSKSSKENEAKFDLAANVGVSLVTVDVYYGNYVQVKDGKKPETVVTAENLLSAKAVFDIAKLAETVPVKVTITGIDLLNRYDNTNAAHLLDGKQWYITNIGKAYGKIVDVAVNTTALANFDITVTGGDLFNKSATNLDVDVIYTGIENLKLEADVNYEFSTKWTETAVKGTYTAEKYEAEVELDLATDFEYALFGFGASIKSDKLVDGATLKAAFAGITFGYEQNKAVKTNTLGALTLSCEVEF